jgi:hypothetical protein
VSADAHYTLAGDEDPKPAEGLAGTGRIIRPWFPRLGIAIRVLGPGEPNATYHGETEQEDFLVLSGEALVILAASSRQFQKDGPWGF